METLTLAEFLDRLKGQGVPRHHLAFRCAVCGTLQSMVSLAIAGVAPADCERFIGFSCVGRWTNAGPHDGGPPGLGCDWTLGGLFQLHKLEVVTEDGVRHPRFVPATPAEAQDLMCANGPAFDADFVAAAKAEALAEKGGAA